MKSRNYYIIIACILLVISQGIMKVLQAQNIDSLETVLQNTEKDSLKIELLAILSEACLSENPSKSENYAEVAMRLARRSSINRNTEANLYNTLGAAYFYQKKYWRSIRNYEKELEVLKEIGNKDRTMRALFNIASISQQLDKHKRAAEYYLQSLALAEELNLKDIVMFNYEALADAYTKTEDFEEALTYYKLFVNIRDSVVREQYEYIKKAKRKNEILLKQKKVALTQAKKKQELLAEDTIKKAKAIEELSEESKRKEATIKEKEKKQQDLILLFGSIFTIILLFSSLLIWQIRQRKKAYQELALRNGEVHRQKKEIQHQAKELAMKNEELKKLSIVASKTDNAVKIMDSQGNFEWFNEAFTRLYGYTFEEFVENKSQNIIETCTNDSSKAAVVKAMTAKVSTIYEALVTHKSGHRLWMQTTITPILDENHQLLKLVAIDSDITAIKEAEAEILQQKEEIEAQRDEIERQRDIATKRGDKIAKQNKEITDSIIYARRIQTALLPSDETLRELFPNHFIMFRPRDIVSGDFYWVAERNGKAVVAAADCTGHGVPGAFMSMLGFAFLNEIVNKTDEHQKNIAAGEILDQLRNYVITSLKQTGQRGSTHDGMDIALCVFDKDNSCVQFAGAFNPLLIVRDGELIQYKADRMPIGFFIKEQKSFTNRTIELIKGDKLYVYSDGYIDQFGGEKGRKFLSANFKKLLLSLNDKTMNEQKEVLQNTFERWKGENFQQIDDILVIGIEFV